MVSNLKAVESQVFAHVDDKEDVQAVMGHGPDAGYGDHAEDGLVCEHGPCRPEIGVKAGVF